MCMERALHRERSCICGYPNRLISLHAAFLTFCAFWIYLQTWIDMHRYDVPIQCTRTYVLDRLHVGIQRLHVTPN
jgi:hypothetical protein